MVLANPFLPLFFIFIPVKIALTVATKNYLHITLTFLLLFFYLIVLQGWFICLKHSKTGKYMYKFIYKNF